jgi:hypothetical protein
VAAQSTAFDSPMPGRPGRIRRLDLQFLRASGLAQARLQLAVLAGNRRRALEQIDRLVAIDKQLERMAQGRGGPVPDPQHLDGDLADQRLAIASEKLALTSQVSLPRLEPAFGAGMGSALGPHEDVEIVEDDVLASRFSQLLLWASGLLVLSLGVAAAAVTQM